ncbi:Mpp10 protein-domain-containing protein [Butyriboletus roseoflavus]|nr:Mpp10 protein-domain-containing protein [Butyriboletus roseoflavus]
MSTHEQRLAALHTEIQALEAENVAAKEWTLLGEASARARPHDSLLQEDLEFERATRHIPIVTDAVVAALEERIKTRIKESRFDDVVRRRPMDAVPFLPSRLVQLQDTKSTQSLAQIYEGAYVAAQSGTSVDDRDGRLRREHDEITRLWEGICAKLDALCNAHYVPKPVRSNLSSPFPLGLVMWDVAHGDEVDSRKRVSRQCRTSRLPHSNRRCPLADQPPSILAPEEVLTPASTSDVRARSELTPAEKRTRRTKERKAQKKMRDALTKTADRYAKTKTRSDKSSAKQDKEAALKSLVKSGKGVTVVGKGNKMQQKTGKLAKKVK